MNELIPVHCDGQDEPTISGRDLHEFLDVETDYRHWFPRMCEYGFADGTDFRTKMTESTGGRRSADHELTLTMAKEICMLQRTERGKQARQYFISLEAAWNTPEMVMARALRMADTQIRQLTGQVEKLRPLATFAEACQKSDDSILIRELANVAGKKGLPIGEKRLYALLREWRMIYRKEGRNLPFQRYIENGMFEVTETPYIIEGETRLCLTTRVTPKGQIHIINRLRQTKMQEVAK